ncbi:uncharacterized protein LOC123910354 [Trifolium pratense]|uniref:uncharacterized protein LOC123910354 n=1 Tax=Trifolium pratense TaxID=57577 RepID=UPI001E6969AD|nr:uncharacterized protein LOC123910354 [Trifolium pratense]
MEKTRLNNLFPLTPSSTFSTKKGRSGYEPSDTETEWQDTPRYERGGRNNVTLSPEETRVTSVRNKSPMTLHKRRLSRFEFEVPSSPSVTGSVLSQPRRRHHSKSPYRPRIAQDDGNNDDDSLSYITGLNSRRNTSPLPRPDFGRTVSPYNRTHEQRTPSNENRKASSGFLEVDRVSTKPNYRRAVTAPRLRDQEQTLQNTRMLKQREKSPFKTGPVREREINEMIAEVKLSKNPTDDYSSALESTDSIQTGDLFFSRECNALQAKNSALPKKVQQYGYFSPRPVITDINPISNPSEVRSNLNMNMPRNSSNVLLSRTTRVTSIRKGSGTGKTHTNPSVKSDASAKTTDSMRKFTSNRKKNQKDAWFACMMRTGNCKISRKSPERKPIDEASLIERAIIVESIPQFWADKHQPASLNGFICNKQEAQLLKELVSSQGSCPHILLKGPSSSEKGELAMALLREIYGDACSNDKRTMKVSVPITSSSHHMELNVNSEPNAKYALMGLIKEISNIYAITPEVSNANFKSDYKVIILYEVDKAVENIQHLIKWIIDRYSDICKLVLCCEDDENIIAPVKTRFKVINVDAPQTHEIIEALTQIANKEEIDLSMNFAMKIATKSKQNLREAILALETCRAHNYPFSEEQPIPVGWEKIVIEVSVEILTDPSFSRLLSIRGKFQMLLLDFVHPRLILLKLVEQLLRKTDAGLKRELYYWHAYYVSNDFSSYNLS